MCAMIDGRADRCLAKPIANVRAITKIALNHLCVCVCVCVCVRVRACTSASVCTCACAILRMCHVRTHVCVCCVYQGVGLITELAELSVIFVQCKIYLHVYMFM